MPQSLEKRVEILEGQRPGREQIVLVCGPGEEDQALKRYLAEHPEHSDAFRYEIITVYSGIPRAPVDPLPPGPERDPKHVEQPLTASTSVMSGERQYRRNTEGQLEEVRGPLGQDAFHTDPGSFPYRR